MRRRAESEQPVKGSTANGPKRTSATPSVANLEEQIGILTRELKESRKQQTATAGTTFELSDKSFVNYAIWTVNTSLSSTLSAFERRLRSQMLPWGTKKQNGVDWAPCS